MGISDVSGGDNLLHFIGKYEPSSNFGYKERLCFRMLDGMEDGGLLEIVPKSFNRNIQKVNLTMRHPSGFYLFYSGHDIDLIFGNKKVYQEKISAFISDEISPHKKLNNLGEYFGTEFEKFVLRSPEHIPSNEEHKSISNFMR